jgi:hypothetical protein
MVQIPVVVARVEQMVAVALAATTCQVAQDLAAMAVQVVAVEQKYLRHL